MPTAIMFYSIAFMYFCFGMSGMGDWNFAISFLWVISATIFAVSDD